MLLRPLIELGLVVEEDAQDGDGHAGRVGQRHWIAKQHDGNGDHENALRSVGDLRGEIM